MPKENPIITTPMPINSTVVGMPRKINNPPKIKVTFAILNQSIHLKYLAKRSPRPRAQRKTIE